MTRGRARRCRRTFRAMGTSWQFEAADCRPALLREAEQLVRAAEARLSRFLPTSLVSILNDERSVDDRELADVIELALRWRALTDGAFDAAVGQQVIDAGYDRSFECLGDPVRTCPRSRTGELRVTVRSDRVVLEGEGRVDLGGIAKGWTADRVADLLDAENVERYAIDAGGDLRVGGRASIEESINLCTGGYRIGIVRGAVATSSTLHRRWATEDGIRHHIIDPTRGGSAEHEWVMTSVVARDTATADALATALLADCQRALKALRHVDADALLVSSGGGCFMTPGLQSYLR